MDTIIKRFLQAKHWHLFLIMIGVPIIGQIYFMSKLFGEIIRNPPQQPVFENFFLIPMILGVITLSVFFLWFYSMSMGLQKMIPDGIKMNVNRFKIFFYFPIVYFIALIGFIYYMINLGQSGMPPPQNLVSGIGLIIPLHLFAMFCMFHTLYFAAKTVKTVEFQREVTFSDYAGEFFLLWFYFVGVWIIQPKINKWVKEGPPEKDTDTFEDRKW